MKSIKEGYEEMMLEVSPHLATNPLPEQIKEFARAAFYRGSRHVIAQIALAESPKDIARTIGNLGKESNEAHRQAMNERTSGA